MTLNYLADMKVLCFALDRQSFTVLKPPPAGTDLEHVAALEDFVGRGAPRVADGKIFYLEFRKSPGEARIIVKERKSAERTSNDSWRRLNKKHDQRLPPLKDMAIVRILEGDCDGE